MSKTFDPYYTWLGIPPEEQPPSHYRLLGVKSFEDNLDAIEHAADRQMAHLRTFQSGPNSNDSQKLLNEVAGAKVTLLNAEKKAEYDEDLREQMKPPVKPKSGIRKAAPLPVADPLTDDSIPRPNLNTDEPTPAAKVSSAAGKQKMLVAVGAGGIAFLLLAIGLVAWLGSRGGDENPDVAGAEQPKDPKTPPKTPSSPEAPQPILQLDKAWTDLMPHINVDAMPTWQRNGEGISSARKGARLELPCNIVGSYDVQVDVNVARRGEYTVITLPLRERFAVFRLETKRGSARLGYLDDNRYAATTKDPIAPGKFNGTCTLNVRLEGESGVRIDARLSETSLFSWSGEESQFSQPQSKFLAGLPSDRIVLMGSPGAKFGGIRVRTGADEPLVIAAVDPPIEPIPGLPTDPGTQPVDPLVDPPVDPLVDPPVDPLVDPPVGLPVDPPVAEVPAAEPPKPTRHAVPGPDDQQRILTALAEVYELDKAQTIDQKITLAKELLELASDPKGIPAERFVMCRKAMDLAREAGDAVLMLKAVDDMGAADIDINLIDAKANIFSKYAEEARDPARMKSLVDIVPVLVEEANADKRYDVAYNVVKIAHGATAKPAGLQYRKGLADMLQEMEGLAEQVRKIEQAKASLQTNPDDPAANLLVGRWLCFGKGQWDEGIPHLAKGSDPNLAAAASKELTPPADPEAMVALGDVWWDMIESVPEEDKKNLYGRAGYWYRKAQGDLSGGLAKIKVAKRLEEIDEISPPPEPADGGPIQVGSPLPVGKWVDVMPLLTDKKLKHNETWTREGDTLVAKIDGGGDYSLPLFLGGNYDLQVDFTRHTGSYYVLVDLPVGNRTVTLMMDYKGTSGLGAIAGQRATENATTRKDVWEREKKYTTLTKVRSDGETASLEVLRDGEVFMSWKGNTGDLREFHPSSRRRKNLPSLRLVNSHVTYHTAKVQLVSGAGEVLDAQGRTRDEMIAAGEPPPGVKIDPLSFLPTGVLKDEKGAYRLDGERHRLSLAQPINAPWILEFDAMLPERKHGFAVMFGTGGGAKCYLHIYAQHSCSLRYYPPAGERAYLARLPEEAAARILAGKPFRVRMAVGVGGVQVLLNGVPAIQAVDRRITPVGEISITGNPAVIANPKVQVVGDAVPKGGVPKKPHKVVPKKPAKAVRKELKKQQGQQGQQGQH